MAHKHAQIRRDFAGTMEAVGKTREPPGASVFDPKALVGLRGSDREMHAGLTQMHEKAAQAHQTFKGKKKD